MEGRGPELLGGSEETSTLGKKFSFCKSPGPCPERACLAMGCTCTRVPVCVCARVCIVCGCTCVRL